MSIKRKSLIFSVFTVLFVSLICTTAVTAQATAAASGNPVAEEYFGPEGVDFSPTSGFLAIKLTLSFPSGVVASRTFTKGKNPYFYLSDPFGCNVTDGLFAYELRAYYSEDPNSQARDPECEGLFTPKAVVQAGFF
ncbi:MAG: hypothetical protein GY940_27695, partial [bacterium]|nr:hypothetical protein [bacterium]